MSTRSISVVLTLVFAVAGAGRGAAETFVLPAVVKGVPGITGSFWETEVRILRMSLQEPFVVQRVWVATAEGGFVDDPATAPRWEYPVAGFSTGRARMLMLLGSDLLAGVTAASGAVAIETEGSAVVYLRTTNTANAPPIVWGTYGTRGNGWLVPATGTPLRGPSTIPWCTTGLALDPEVWAYRTSLGFVNGNPQPLDLRVSVVLIGEESYYPHFWFDSWQSTRLFTVVHLPAWGRVQIDDVFSSLVICSPIGCGILMNEAPVLFIIEPLQDLPYFAYSSQIFSRLNDPEIVLAVPGLPEGIPYQ